MNENSEVSCLPLPYHPAHTVKTVASVMVVEFAAISVQELGQTTLYTPLSHISKYKVKECAGS